MAADQVVCANEIGVVGHFHEHVGHVMTCIGMDVGMPLRFGIKMGEEESLTLLSGVGIIQLPSLDTKLKTQACLNAAFSRFILGSQISLLMKTNPEICGKYQLDPVGGWRGQDALDH